MDPRTVVFISNLLLLTAEQTLGQVDSVTSPPAQTSNSTNRNCFCPSIAPAATAASIPTIDCAAPALGLLTVKWSNCEGEVHLMLHHPFISSLPVCHKSMSDIKGVLGNVCENKKGCEGKPSWPKRGEPKSGYSITESGAEELTCNTLKVYCNDSPDQLQTYQVVTALLCCVLLVLLVIRFTRPTVKALQKRLSDRRQNRWIGPTQSHSVSYHRGKTAVRNDDGEKRVSYPALERLAVSDSREPSSNRNSDYNF